MNIITHSFKETQMVGESFAKKIKGGNVLFLFGDLGSGKTTFMQGLAKGLGIKRRIISPTFIIVRKYEISPSLKNTKIASLYHIDLYRTQTVDDLKGLGLEEILQEKDAIVAIEWPEKLSSLTPKNRWELHFEIMGEDKRSITEKNKYGQ